MQQQLHAAGIIGVRPSALIGVCALLFALPIALLLALLPLLSEEQAWLQLLVIVSVVSLIGGVARYHRKQLLRWLLIVPESSAAAHAVERLSSAGV
ncbi:MAG: hypothetical protein AB8B93_09150 [Pseudomonadales bacterium]